MGAFLAAATVKQNNHLGILFHKESQTPLLPAADLTIHTRQTSLMVQAPALTVVHATKIKSTRGTVSRSQEARLRNSKIGQLLDQQMPASNQHVKSTVRWVEHVPAEHMPVSTAATTAWASHPHKNVNYDPVVGPSRIIGSSFHENVKPSRLLPQYLVPLLIASHCSINGNGLHQCRLPPASDLSNPPCSFTHAGYMRP